MKKVLLSVLVLIAAVFSQAAKEKTRASKKGAVLVFSKTRGFRHGSIEKGIEAIKKLGKQHKFKVTATEDSSLFVPDTLAKYAAVIFLSTTGNVLNEPEEAAFTKYINDGGGYVGIHAAADCEYDWPWYGGLVGGYFKSHPKQQMARLNIVDKKNRATKALPAVWERFDEWYNYKSFSPGIKVLITIDETSYKGGENGDNHPMAWYHSYEGGRAFYTALGHTDETFDDPLFLGHLLGGIEYAMGRK